MNQLTEGMLRGAMGGSASANKNFEPQRVNNARLEVALGDSSLGDTNILTFSVSTMALPKMNNGIIEVGYFNEKRKFAGNAQFDDLQIAFTDYLDTDTLRILLNWKYQVYNPQNGQVGLSSRYKKQGRMILTSPDNDVSRERIWQLYGMWPSSLDPGEVDMAGEDVVRINVTFTIDKAIPGKGINPLTPGSESVALA